MRKDLISTQTDYLVYMLMNQNCRKEWLIIPYQERFQLLSSTLQRTPQVVNGKKEHVSLQTWGELELTVFGDLLDFPLNVRGSLI